MKPRSRPRQHPVVTIDGVELPDEQVGVVINALASCLDEMTATEDIQKRFSDIIAKYHPVLARFGVNYRL